MKIALLMPNNSNWTGGARAGIYENFLKQAGHDVQLFFLKRDQYPSGLEGFDIVFNHAMQAPASKLRSLACSNRKTTIVHVNHSSIGHLDQQESIKTTRSTRKGQIKPQGDMTRKLCDILYAARDVNNIWYASVDLPYIAKAAGIDRAIQLPTPMPDLTNRQFRPARDIPVVAIVGRDDPIKNRMNQYIAAAMLKENLSIHFVTEKTELLVNTMKALGVDLSDKSSRHKIIPTMPHAKWICYLSEEPDLILQCSYSESFNNVACEAMQVGVPVVTSDAIKIGCKEHRADANDPMSIVRAIEEILGNYKESCEASTSRGREVAASCREGYSKAIEILKGGSASFHPVSLPRIKTKKSGKRCIAVVNGDKESEEVFDLSKSAFEKYASKTKSELIEIKEQPLESYRIGNKWLCTSLADSFEKVLYLDCDVWIQDGAADIFEAVPHGKFGAYNELGHVNYSVTKAKMAEIAKDLGIYFEEPKTSLNAGVMVFDSKCHKLYSQPESEVRNSHTLDQDLLSLNVMQSPEMWEPIDEKFNWVFFRKDFWSGFGKSWFVHLAGARPHAYRCELLRRFNSGIFDPLRPPCKIKCNPPWLSHIES